MVHPLVGAALGAYSGQKLYQGLFGDDEESPGPSIISKIFDRLRNDPARLDQMLGGRLSESEMPSHKHHKNKHLYEVSPIQKFKEGGDIESLDFLNKKKDDNLIVHVNKEECKAFDLLQGGPQFIQVDDDFSRRMQALGVPIHGKIRDYRPLEEILQNPEIQKVFAAVLQKMDKEGPDSPQLEPYYQIGKEALGEMEGGFSDPSQKDPELSFLEHEGKEGDTELAYMPLFVCDFLDSIKGEVSTNPTTGFPQYGGNFSKSIVRVVTTVAGAIPGGPLGAAAGNFAGRMLTGQSPGKAIMASLPNAAYTAGVQGVGSLVGQYGPASLAGYGNSIAGMGGNWSTANMLNNLIGTGGSGTAASVAGATAAGTPGSVASAASGATAPTATGGGGLFGSLFGGGSGSGSLLSSLATPAALALGAYGIHNIKKGKKEEVAAWEKENKRRKEELEEARQRAGFNDSLAPLQGNIYEDRQRDMMDYYKNKPAPNFKKGGHPHFGKNKELVNFVDVSESYKGKGAGQADNLKKKLPVNGYIIPADVVAMVGEGNSNAGQDILKKMEARLKSKYNGMRVKKKLATVKGNTSDGEHQHSPLYVTLLGQGNNDMGAQKLDKAIEAYRVDKTKNGPHLQPKSKPFDHYLR